MRPIVRGEDLLCRVPGGREIVRSLLCSPLPSPALLYSALLYSALLYSALIPGWITSTACSVTLPLDSA